MEQEPARTLPELARRRDAILARIVALIEADERVVAAWLTGSHGRGEDDAWSDLDLHLAVADADLEDWWAGRDEVYRAIAPPLFLQREMPSNAQEGAHFQLVIFPGPVEVDWNVGPVSLATRPPTSRMLVERFTVPLIPAPPLGEDDRIDRLQESVAFFWAMVPIAVKYAGRGATTDAVMQIQLLSRALAETWWLVRGSPNLSSPNPLLEPELVAILPALDPVIDPPRCLAAIAAAMAEMGAMQPELAANGVDWPEALVAQVEAMVGIARAAIGERETIR